MEKKVKADMVKREMLCRKNMQDSSKKGFNFVGSEYKWTSIDEQKMKVEEIENIEKKN